MKGRREAAEERHNAAISLAWHVEAFARTKKLPDLKKLLIAPAQAPRQQTPAEMLSAMRGWVQATRH